MRTALTAIVLLIAPSLAVAQTEPVFGNSYYDYHDEPKTEVERGVREYERQEIAQQAQRDFWYQQEQADREKAMLKELRDINDNQRRAMGEVVYPRFKD